MESLNKTIDISATAQDIIGIDTMVHMTCTRLTEDEIRESLKRCHSHGIQNILALRGDPPSNPSKSTLQPNHTLRYASDLVELIRKEFGDYFCICVAGYPEGHPGCSYEDDLRYLKLKVDAGADFIITQLFFDCDEYLKFVKDCHAIGITCPIVPGILPIQSYNGFRRMVDLCKVKVPKSVEDDLAKLNISDDAELKAYGIKLCVTMCKYLLQHDVRSLHFYTLNLEKSVLDTLNQLDLHIPTIHRTLPWKPTANAKRRKEDVRPVFWKNRPCSYVSRTAVWDEFPNGRWTDSQSPAFGQLVGYHALPFQRAKPEELRSMWGEAVESEMDVQNVFERYLTGEIKLLPWDENTGMSKETHIIKDDLLRINRKGFWTINSQPVVNGAPSTDPVHGWGPKDGIVYQKSYLEFFISPERFVTLRERLEKSGTITYFAVNAQGDLFTNSNSDVNAVTWGVFTNSEILQPTVVDRVSFLVWKDEAFAMWRSWAELYDSESISHKTLLRIHDTYMLVNIVENNFVGGDIFSIFNDAL